uniref:Uncharacterized protein n=1 Tax=Romanomermis culicivorax TaxID=13658 RepID=A0A915IQH9_ROMCU
MKKKKKDWLLCLSIVTFTLLGLYASCYIYVFGNYDTYTGLRYNTSRSDLIELRNSHARTLETSVASTFNFPKLDSSCSFVDIVVVVGGNTAIRRVLPLLKSLLLYRTRVLRLHFVVVDLLSQRIITTLMSTWQITGVEYATYNAQNLLDSLRWIPNNHYSGVYGLLKLLLPEILPLTLHRIIVLDNDLLFNADVLDLWSLFTEFNDDQVLGLVENLSPWYLGLLPMKYSPWPAVKRGFNTGVILMDLRKLRSLEWSKTWPTVCNSTLSSHGPLGLADQDVFNAWIKNKPSSVYTVHCKWNFQIGKSFSYEYCKLRANKVKIIHFNSVFKSGDIRDQVADHFRKRYRNFLEMNNLLGNAWENTKCAENYSKVVSVTNPTEKDDPCEDFSAPIVYRTHLYYKDCYYEPKAVDVTLVTQLSFDRIFMLEPLLNRWNGPASITLYLTDEEAARFQDFMIESHILSSRLDVALHVVYRQEVFFRIYFLSFLTYITNFLLHNNFYPVNKLRNIALREVNTSHVFLSDVDFIPSIGSYEYLLTFLNDT